MPPTTELAAQERAPALPTTDERKYPCVTGADGVPRISGVAVDPAQGFKATELQLCTLKRPHMRAFHFQWLSFFMAFMVWFAYAPLLVVIRQDLDIPKKGIWMSNVFNVAACVVARFVVGPLGDVYGAVKVQTALLAFCGICTFFAGFVNSLAELCLMRFLIGVGGATFVITHDGVEATILESRVADLRDLIGSVLSRNVVSVKELRSLTGKAQSMASLLYVWRPFVHMLYGAITADTYGNAPPGTRWVKQVSQPLQWLMAFLDGVVGSLVRRFPLTSYQRRGDFLSITTDASPNGLGLRLSLLKRIDTLVSRWGTCMAAPWALHAWTPTRSTGRGIGSGLRIWRTRPRQGLW